MQKKKIDKNISNQVEKLLSFLYKRYNVSKFATSVDPITFHEEFMSIATLYILDKLDYYDAEKGKLSTFVNMIFCNMLYLWANMANYGHSYSEARAFYKIQKVQKDSGGKKLIPTPIVPLSYDNTFVGDSESKNSDISIVNTVVDPEAEEEINAIVNKSVYDEAMEYINNTKTISKNQRKYLLAYIETGKIQDVADKYGVSRQAVSGAILKASERLKDVPIIKQCCGIID